MSFLNPVLWTALIPLLALPLVIHLLNKGFPRRFPFPSIELIKATLAQRSRVDRWRHWILLLLRMLFLGLLLLAFLLPIIKRFNADPAAAGQRHVLIVLDHSLSMEHRGDGPTSRERAEHEATKLIESLDPEDGVNVLLMDAVPTTCFVDFSQDHTEARRFLDHVPPGFSKADVNQANAFVARLVAKENSRTEIYYLSDFQRKNWANADFTALSPSAKLFFVDVGPVHRDNHAVLEARPAQAEILAGDTVPLEVTIGNFSDRPFDDRVTVTVDGRFSFNQDISIAPWSQSKTIVPVAVGGPGIHQCEVRLPADALEADDHYRLTLSVRQKQEILVVSDGTDDVHGSAYFLKTALNPFENEAGSLLPRIVSSGELTGARLAGVHQVFLTQVNHLGPDASAAVAKFMFDGGGVVYFLDGTADAENVSDLETAIGPNKMPMRLAQKKTAARTGTGAQQVARGDFHSRYLKLFQGTARQNLGLLEFYDYYQAAATGNGNVLLAYADDSPAMAELHHGLGTMLLMNFSVDEFSSNLSRQRMFPAWMHELVKALSADEPPPASYIVGEPLHADIWKKDLVEATLADPAGAAVTTVREPDGERYHVTFRPTQLGFYTVGKPRPAYAFAVNASPDESDLRPVDPDVLPKEFAGNHEAHFVAGADDFDALAHGRPLFHWFVIGAIGFLLLETGFQFFLRRKQA